jgi:peptide/nickel transport system ATP-binding protein
LDAPSGERLAAISGSVSDNLPWTSACAFAPRCPRELPDCRAVTPPTEDAMQRLLSCHNPVPVQVRS